MLDAAVSAETNDDNGLEKTTMVMMMTKALVALMASMAVSVSAFCPQTPSVRTSMELAAGRREILGAVGAAFAGLAGQQLTQQTSPTLIAGLTNPAGETFKSKGGKRGQSFIPGKGMRMRDEDLLAGLTNPAGETFKSKGGKRGQSFIPGKGMRIREEDVIA